jgi:hypothetical protein
MSGFLQQILSPVVFRPRRRFEEFTRYLTIDESGEDELVITEHPVQAGAEITDHAYKKSATLSMNVQFSAAESLEPLDETYRRMLELQESRIPFDVVTGKRVYNNMLFKSLKVTTDRFTDNVLAISMQLKEIIITNVTVTTVPPRADQKEPGRTGATEKAGQKKPQESPDQPRRQSALKKAAGLI